MLAALRRGVRFRIAIAMAALAVFAFVAPPIAVAFGPTPGTIYCLTHYDQGMGHSHHDHAVADHRAGDLDQTKSSHEEGEHKSHCCGLFCVTALTPEVRGMPAPLLLQPERSSVVAFGFRGRTPEQPFRPPIPRLSF
jgi:hypothetical protein